MLRLRRSRVFVFIAALTTLTIYQLSNVRDWDVTSIESLKNIGLQKGVITAATVAIPPSTSSIRVVAVPTANAVLLSSSDVFPLMQTTLLFRSESLPDASTSVGSTRATTSTFSTTKPLPPKFRPAKSEEDRLADDLPVVEEFGQHGQGRLEVDTPQNSKLPKAHWKPQKEHFPLLPGAVLALPTGKSKAIPKIQHVFADESSSAKADRQRKLGTIKEAFKHAWSGYVTYAMPHDELAPVSGDVKDPFNGWGATLVDSLDTLWIMGLKEEFEVAVDAVKGIDFTTSIRKDIPLFETVIRYLGGLLAAYDLTSGKYLVLLDKAVELAEVLMGAFDTPNRMPITFYYWAPSYASQQHRAGTRVVLAELGSLSVEFTRLAQITKESRYYDAVARITNELEKWQNITTLPGLWPTHIDASGCRKPESPEILTSSSASRGPESQGRHAALGLGDESNTADHPKYQPPLKATESMLVRKRQLDLPNPNGIQSNERLGGRRNSYTVGSNTPSGVEEATELDVDCESQGLASPPYSKVDAFSIGAMADSAYEYLPKEYMLLGGLNGQYQTMYESAMETVRQELLFRPMTKQERDILFVGKVTVEDSDKFGKQRKGKKFIYEGTHLTCFAGGMFAIGAKVFDIKEDLELASKITDGCIWAYESTTTGLMPETFELVPCESRSHCEWNETKWWESLDPHEKARIEQVAIWNEKHLAFLEQEAHFAATQATQSGTPADTGMPLSPKAKMGTSMIYGDPDHLVSYPTDKLNKRQIGKSRPMYEPENMAERKNEDQPATADDSSKQPTKTKIRVVDDVVSNRATLPSVQPVFPPKVVVSHQEYVQARIREERLPPGFTAIASNKYILRPEAIESVFIMYRVTGEDYWREKAWKMFTAIESYTRTEIANSAISDVTSEVPVFADTMESFWLAETLKYFYLLYSDPGFISLDDYVL